MTLDQIKALVDEFEKAVENLSTQVDCGTCMRAHRAAEVARDESKKALIDAIERGLSERGMDVEKG